MAKIDYAAEAARLAAQPGRDEALLRAYQAAADEAALTKRDREPDKDALVELEPTNPDVEGNPTPNAASPTAHLDADAPEGLAAKVEAERTGAVARDEVAKENAVEDLKE